MSATYHLGSASELESELWYWQNSNTYIQVLSYFNLYLTLSSCYQKYNLMYVLKSWNLKKKKKRILLKKIKLFQFGFSLQGFLHLLATLANTDFLKKT